MGATYAKGKMVQHYTNLSTMIQCLSEKHSLMWANTILHFVLKDSISIALKLTTTNDVNSHLLAAVMVGILSKYSTIQSRHVSITKKYKLNLQTEKEKADKNELSKLGLGKPNLITHSLTATILTATAAIVVMCFLTLWFCLCSVLDHVKN